MVARRSEETPESSPATSARSAASRRTLGSSACARSSRCRTAAASPAHFCVIPFVRGESRSRRAAAVVREVRRRVEQGHKEIVLTGINLGCYRDREAGYTLPRLIREVGELPGLARLRLSSIEVNHVNEELVGRAARDAVAGAPSARSAAVGRRRRAAGDGAALRRGHVPAPRRAARRLQPHDGRDRRLPGRGRAGVRAHAGPRSPGRRSRASTSSRTRRGRGRRPPPPTRSRPRSSSERGARLRELSRAASLERWRSKVGSEDVVLVDRPGRGYGDDYSPWLLRRRGRRARACPRARGHRGGDPRCLTTASSVELVRDGDHVRAADGFVAVQRHQPEGRDAPARDPGAPRRHVPRDRRVPAGRGEADARVRRRDGARCRARGLPRDRQRGRGRRPDRLPPALARARRAVRGGCRYEPDRAARGRAQAGDGRARHASGGTRCA